MKSHLVISILIVLFFSLSSCKKEKPVAPVLTTAIITEISYTTATSGGEVTNNGGAMIVTRGICWSTSSSPSSDDFKTIEGGTGAFVSKITNLTQNTKYYVRAYAVNSAGTGYGNELSFTTSQVSVPVLTTTDISSISFRTAISGGNITSDKGEPVITRGICWNTAANPTVADSKTSDGTGTGSFVSNLTGLTPNTTYYARAYATNNVGTAYGFQVSFTTRQVTVPSLTTAAVSLVTQKSAVSGGIVSDDNGETVTSKGVCWSVTANPTINDSKTSDGAGTATFESNLTGLTANTTYFIRAYAINNIGAGYGEQQSFKTNQITGSLNTGLISYYPFNGSADDASGNNNNGVISGATLSTDIFGHPNSAFYFNGISNYISLKPETSFTGLNNYTISLWVKPTAFPTNGGGMIYGLGSIYYGPVHGLTYQSSGALFSGSYNAGGNPVQSNSQSCCYTPNNWYYVVVTRNNSSIYIYINGTLILPQAASSTNGQNADYGTGPFSAILGGRSSLDSQYFFKGIIDEVRIYNRVLSAGEISELKTLNQ
jgi:hypothetical protein